MSYHSANLVPSSAVASDLLVTSQTPASAHAGRAGFRKTARVYFLYLMTFEFDPAKSLANKDHWTHRADLLDCHGDISP